MIRYAIGQVLGFVVDVARERCDQLRWVVRDRWDGVTWQAVRERDAARAEVEQSRARTDGAVWWGTRALEQAAEARRECDAARAEVERLGDVIAEQSARLAGYVRADEEDEAVATALSRAMLREAMDINPALEKFPGTPLVALREGIEQLRRERDAAVRDMDVARASTPVALAVIEAARDLARANNGTVHADRCREDLRDALRAYDESRTL